MSPTTTVRLALAGKRTDRVRLVLHATGSAVMTVGLLTAATLLVVPRAVDRARPYANALWSNPQGYAGSILALLLAVTVALLFVAQSTRLGSRERDRRLAGFRLGGGTSGQLAGLVATESGLAAAVGTAVGLAAYFVGRVVLDDPGARSIPTDLLPPTWAIVLIALAVPAAVVGLAILATNRVMAEPFAAVREQSRRSPQAWPATMFAIGLPGTVLSRAVAFEVPDRNEALAIALLAIYVVSLVLMLLGLVMGTAWFAYACGRVLHRLARGPVVLMAARRLIADPRAGSWTYSAILIAVLAGTYAASQESDLPLAAMATRWDTVYTLIYVSVASTMLLAAASLVVILAEQTMARRRSLASAGAAGAGPGTLARTTLVQIMVPFVPIALLACVPVVSVTLLTVAPRSFHSDGTVETMPVTPVPWSAVATLTGGAVLTILVATAIGLYFLREHPDMTDLRVK